MALRLDFDDHTGQLQRTMPHNMAERVQSIDWTQFLATMDDFNQQYRKQGFKAMAFLGALVALTVLSWFVVPISPPGFLHLLQLVPLFIGICYVIFRGRQADAATQEMMTKACAEFSERHHGITLILKSETYVVAEARVFDSDGDHHQRIRNKRRNYIEVTFESSGQAGCVAVPMPASNFNCSPKAVGVSFCTHCGATASGGGTFCTSCGQQYGPASIV